MPDKYDATYNGTSVGLLFSNMVFVSISLY